eukprot:2084948-Rhodomonas_salina.1
MSVRGHWPGVTLVTVVVQLLKKNPTRVGTILRQQQFPKLESQESQGRQGKAKKAKAYPGRNSHRMGNSGYWYLWYPGSPGYPGRNFLLPGYCDTCTMVTGYHWLVTGNL